jgi:hypothetical protein
MQTCFSPVANQQDNNPEVVEINNVAIVRLNIDHSGQVLDLVKDDQDPTDQVLALIEGAAQQPLDVILSTGWSEHELPLIHVFCLQAIQQCVLSVFLMLGRLD